MIISLFLCPQQAKDGETTAICWKDFDLNMNMNSIHAYIHTYIHRYIHTYIYIYTRIYKHIACINTKKHDPFVDLDPQWIFVRLCGLGNVIFSR